mgnify:CR=1 FL=1
MTAAPPAEQLNLKVKSQVITSLFRMEKKSSSKSKTPLSSKSSWTPTVNDNLYPLSYSAQVKQCQIPFRRRKAPWKSIPQGPQHGKWRLNWCSDRASWRKPPLNLISITLSFIPLPYYHSFFHYFLFPLIYHFVNIAYEIRQYDQSEGSFILGTLFSLNRSTQLSQISASTDSDSLSIP